MSTPQPINLEVCRADYEVASRKPQLAEVWFYEYGFRLLNELEAARKEPVTDFECFECGSQVVGGTCSHEQCDTNTGT